MEAKRPGAGNVVHATRYAGACAAACGGECRDVQAVRRTDLPVRRQQQAVGTE